MVAQAHKRFIGAFCQALQEAGCDYVFLSGIDDTPLRLLVAPDGLEILPEDSNWTLLSAMNGRRLFWHAEAGFLDLSVTNGYTVYGLPLLEAQTLLAQAIPTAKTPWLRILPEEAQLAVSIADAVFDDGYFSAALWPTLTAGVKHNRVGLRRQFAAGLGPQYASALVNVIADGDRMRANDFLPRLRRAFLTYQLSQGPLLALSASLTALRRLLKAHYQARHRLVIGWDSHADAETPRDEFTQWLAPHFTVKCTDNPRKHILHWMSLAPRPRVIMGMQTHAWPSWLRKILRFDVAFALDHEDASELRKYAGSYEDVRLLSTQQQTLASLQGLFAQEIKR